MIDFKKFEWPKLPVLEQEAAFLDALTKHSVIILQGETGSGKTTQIPKLCLKAGLHEKGLIGCTQPRRIAALSICDRLRQETQHDEIIGTQIRFHSDCPKDMAVKVMTDGILLQEYQKDPLLRKYSCLIIDEAHERSLNIDILLGILNLLKESRPDLRIIITSATIDASAFSEFFSGAPIIVAEGKTFPVDTLYLDPFEAGTDDLIGLAAQAIETLQSDRKDHTLCFLPTEKDILELKDTLEGQFGQEYSILPLYGRLTPQEQKAIFQVNDKIKIVLSTNIAETSLTIPGIAYVVDLGLARISRYHSSTRIQGLPIEPISQASANQRKGRAGRVKPGVCVRLYSEDHFNQRPAYTDPEILRSNLANVMLTMINLGLDLERFPLLDPPKNAAIRGARVHLYELGALDSTAPHAKITPLGSRMMKLPLDVTLAHLLLKAQEKQVLGPALILAAGLSVQEMRIHPRDPKEKALAEGKHFQVKHKKSDFMTLLGLWNRTHKSLGDSWSLSKLRKHCQEYYLNFLKMREWIQLYQQFSKLMKFDHKKFELDFKKMSEDALHQSLLSAFLGTLAKKETQERFYRLAGGRESWIFPGSVLFKKNPDWILASEIRETSKVYLARNCEIKPSWIPQVAEQFCKKSYEGVAWNRQTGFVEALCVITFKGLRIGAGQRVQYQKIDFEESQKALWLEAIVMGQSQRKPHFYQVNAKILKKLEELQTQMRRPGLCPQEDQILDWYLNQVQKHEVLREIADFKSLEKAIAKHKLNNYLTFDMDEWIQARNQEDQWFEDNATEVISSVKLEELFPTKVRIGKKERKVKYQFDHQSQDDGISIEIYAEDLLASSWQSIIQLIPGWHQRLYEHLIQESPAGVSKIYEKHQADVLKRWRELMNQKSQSPWLSLAETLEKSEEFHEFAHWNPTQFQMPKKQFAHLNLTFKILDLQQDLSFKPTEGPAQWGIKKINLAQKLKEIPFVHLTHDLYFGYVQTGKNSFRPELSIGQGQVCYWKHIALQSKNFWSQGSHRNWADQFVDKWNLNEDRDEAWILLGALRLKGKDKAGIIEWEESLDIPKDELKKVHSSKKLNSLAALADVHQIKKSDASPKMQEQIRWAQQTWKSRYSFPKDSQKYSWKNHKKIWRQECRETLKASPLLAPLNEELRALLDQLEGSQEDKGPKILLKLLAELEQAQLDLYHQKRVSPEDQDSTQIEEDSLLALKNRFKS